MKKLTDKDGNTQRDFLDAPTIDVSFLPSKEALNYRLNHVMDLIHSGDASYSRGIGDLEMYERAASVTNSRIYSHEGVWWSVAGAKGMLRFLKTWEARRNYLLDEAKDLQRSLAIWDK